MTTKVANRIRSIKGMVRNGIDLESAVMKYYDILSEQDIASLKLEHDKNRFPNDHNPRWLFERNKRDRILQFITDAITNNE